MFSQALLNSSCWSKLSFMCRIVCHANRRSNSRCGLMLSSWEPEYMLASSVCHMHFIWFQTHNFITIGVFDELLMLSFFDVDQDFGGGVCFMAVGLCSSDSVVHSDATLHQQKWKSNCTIMCRHVISAVSHVRHHTKLPYENKGGNGTQSRHKLKTLFLRH